MPAQAGLTLSTCTTRPRRPRSNAGLHCTKQADEPGRADVQDDVSRGSCGTRNGPAAPAIAAAPGSGIGQITAMAFAAPESLQYLALLHSADVPTAVALLAVASPGRHTGHAHVCWSRRARMRGSPPATSTTLVRPDAPATRLTSPRRTPNAAATAASAASVALPSTARALTRTTSAPACSPPTAGRAEPGRTRTVIRTSLVCRTRRELIAASGTAPARHTHCAVVPMRVCLLLWAEAAPIAAEGVNRWRPAQRCYARSSGCAKAGEARPVE
jgi:hypothetical protein